MRGRAELHICYWNHIVAKAWRNSGKNNKNNHDFFRSHVFRKQELPPVLKAMFGFVGNPRAPTVCGMWALILVNWYEGLNGVKRVAWNVQKINRVSWKREKINRVSWIIFVQITMLSGASQWEHFQITLHISKVWNPWQSWNQTYSLQDQRTTNVKEVYILLAWKPPWWNVLSRMVMKVARRSRGYPNLMSC